MIKAGSKHLTYAAKRPFLSEAARHAQQQLDDDMARILFEAFSRLRSTSLRIAQMLSMKVLDEA